MRFRTLALQTLIFCLLTAGTATAQDDSLEWLNNYKEALAEAKRTQKPIFLEYRCEP